jgi:hypothetical protein
MTKISLPVKSNMSKNVSRNPLFISGFVVAAVLIIPDLLKAFRILPPLFRYGVAGYPFFFINLSPG